MAKNTTTLGQAIDDNNVLSFETLSGDLSFTTREEQDGYYTVTYYEDGKMTRSRLMHISEFSYMLYNTKVRVTQSKAHA